MNNKNMRCLKKVTQNELIKQWDNVADLRDEQMKSGKDLSYNYILVPSIKKLIEHCDFKHIIDIGCGPGLLAKELASQANKVVCVDMSKNMIAIAKKNNVNLKNVEFVDSTIEEYSKQSSDLKLSLAIANMTLMTTLNLESFLFSVFNILKINGHFVFTITHPCFWPSYYGYAKKSWFKYEQEIIIENTFRISLDHPIHGPKTVHIHRSLERYINAILQTGFKIEQIKELVPSDAVKSMYPKPWEFPRFLGVRCLKSS